MALKTPPSWLQGGSHTAEGDRQVIKSLLNPSSSGREGVIASTALLVQAQAVPNMSVRVAVGDAFVQGDDSALQGAYHTTNEAETTLAIAAANATNPRIDLVVARIRDAAYIGGTWPTPATLEIVQGAAAATPVVPATPATALPLAQVLVPANATSIIAGNITDLRRRASALGGIHVCTSTTRPATPYEGMSIYEENTDLILTWNGAAWLTSDAFGQPALVQLATITLGAPAAIIDFQNIPQTYKHLRLVARLTSDSVDDLYLRFNGDTSGIYHNQRGIFDGGVANGARNTGASGGYVGLIVGVGALDGMSMDSVFQDYAETTKHKTCTGISHSVGGSSPQTRVHGFHRANTAATNRIAVTMVGGSNFRAGSMATLYGMR